MKSNKAIEMGLLAVMFFLPGCVYIPPGVTTTPSGNVVSRRYDFSNFDSIDVGSAFEIAVTRADSYNVTITADDNLFNDIVVEKQGSTLKIGIKTINFPFKPTSKAEISLPELSELPPSKLGGILGANSR